MLKPAQLNVINSLESLGLLTRAQIEEALKAQKDTQERIGNILVKLGHLKPTSLPKVLAMNFGMPPTSISEKKISPEVIKKVPSSLVKLQRIVPLEFSNGTLTVAFASALDFLAQEKLESALHCKIKEVLSSEEEITTAINKYYAASDKAIDDSMVAEAEEELDRISQKQAELTGEATGTDEAPVIKLVVSLIAEAFRNRASDIHLEPLEGKFRVRYRIDGVLHEVTSPPDRLQSSVLSRVKLMAGMNIAEKRLPQDGRIGITLAGKALDLRVSALPGIYGESVVLRILDKSSLLLGMGELGFFADDEEIWKKLISLPYGIILLTGPTGSGKTTTLYGSLNFINRPDRKLITIEDPVEYQLTGINQVEIKPGIGLTFAAGLRSMLRQAPNIIMVGEIRDYETAAIATQAALTGHLVFSTLHTNDAPGAITRLIDMGMKPYLVASSIQAIMAQRLVRKICPRCRESYEPQERDLRLMGIDKEQTRGKIFYRGRGCKECSNAGYKGRIAIFELMIMSRGIKSLTFEKKPSTVIRHKARAEGMRTLREDGARKILAGITTIPEVIRVTQSDID